MPCLYEFKDGHQMLQPDDVVSGGPSSPEGHIESPPVLAAGSSVSKAQASPTGFTPFPAIKFTSDWSVCCLPGPKHLPSYWHETKVQQESGALRASGRG